MKQAQIKALVTEMERQFRRECSQSKMLDVFDRVYPHAKRLYDITGQFPEGLNRDQQVIFYETLMAAEVLPDDFIY